MPRIYSAAEDATIVDLKEVQTFTGWPALAAAFNARFPNLENRPWGTLQVRYSRYLKAGEKYRARAIDELNRITSGTAAAAAAPPPPPPPPPQAVQAIFAAQPPAPPPVVTTAAPVRAPLAVAAAGPVNTATPIAPAASGRARPSRRAASAPAWIEPPLVADDLLRHPVRADFGRGVPREPTALQRLAADEKWHRDFDASMREMGMGTRWSDAPPREDPGVLEGEEIGGRRLRKRKRD